MYARNGMSVLKISFRQSITNGSHIVRDALTIALYTVRQLLLTNSLIKASGGKEICEIKIKIEMIGAELTRHLYCSFGTLQHKESHLRPDCLQCQMVKR